MCVCVDQMTTDDEDEVCVCMIWKEEKEEEGEEEEERIAERNVEKERVSTLCGNGN